MGCPGVTKNEPKCKEELRHRPKREHRRIDAVRGTRFNFRLGVVSGSRKRETREPGFRLAETLPNLFGAKGAYSIEPETKDEPVFFSESHIEGVVLGRDSAAVPAIPERYR